MASTVSLDQLGAFLTASPFHRFLGVQLRHAEAGRIEVVLPFRHELLADEQSPYIHGGVIASLIDLTACFAIISSLGRDVPTIDLRVDYLKAARDEELRAVGHTVKVGRSLGIADVEVFNPAGDVVAIGRGLFSTR
jgi:uncharacterized protein (TIGR00369 family)